MNNRLIEEVQQRTLSAQRVNAEPLLISIWSGLGISDTILKSERGLEYCFHELTNGFELFNEAFLFRNDLHKRIEDCEEGRIHVWDISRWQNDFLENHIVFVTEGNVITEVLGRPSKPIHRKELDILAKWASIHHFLFLIKD